MDMNNPEHPQNGASSAVILEANKPTGEQPMELFITDEHTEHYLALQSGGDSYRGLWTGILGGMGGVAGIGLAVLLMLNGKWDGVPTGLIMSAAFFLVPFLWETFRPLPLPILFNRRTREVYLDHDGELFHAPWDGMSAVANEFQVVGTHIGGMQSASLEIRVWKFEEPEKALMVSLGAPFGKTLQMQKGFWEYIRSYMNNGPYFDVHGNHSQSDAFVKSQLAVKPNMSGWFKDTLNGIKKTKAENGGKNYLGGTDAVMVVCTFLLYPCFRIQELTYSVAKRRSRNLWPALVTERLKHEGPKTRLVDLEQSSAKG
ncbi:hypothetical protein C3E98_000935 [Pseudomonas sp. MWU13-2625]|uniref:hypothetical protein n=1 Tax=unclassified Pseudomonas TaxID=196821 RepID=UPI000CD5A864|nr:hypothetical protein [Pseudomonas sp. MWU12-2020]RBC02086.1 hypothetical protein C3E97_010820 [Pseudomonas sp. MWU12-2115]RBL73125.1 hypothetical protein C3E98_000935 [Pseudomonas sp. MWU13-2625]